MPYKSGTLLGNWFESRLEPVNSESFSGMMLPTGFAHSYRTSYCELANTVTASALKPKSKPSCDNWLTGDSDALTIQERYTSVTAAEYQDPAKKMHETRKPHSHPMQGKALEDYRRKWTNAS